MDSGIGTTESNLAPPLPATGTGKAAFASVAPQACLGDPPFLLKDFCTEITSPLWSSRWMCKEFKTTAPHAGVCYFSPPLQAAGLNEPEHKWAKNRHAYTQIQTHLCVYIYKFISSDCSIALASTGPDLEPLSSHWLWKCGAFSLQDFWQLAPTQRWAEQDRAAHLRWETFASATKKVKYKLT